jgi:hypothetical protein
MPMKEVSLAVTIRTTLTRGQINGGQIVLLNALGRLNAEWSASLPKSKRGQAQKYSERPLSRMSYDSSRLAGAESNFENRVSPVG